MWWLCYYCVVVCYFCMMVVDVAFILVVLCCLVLSGIPVFHGCVLLLCRVFCMIGLGGFLVELCLLHM